MGHQAQQAAQEAGLARPGAPGDHEALAGAEAHAHAAHGGLGAAVIAHLQVLGLHHGLRVRRPGGRHPERITSSTSSRRRSMSASDTSDSRLRRSSGSVLDERTLKCQSS